MNSAREWSQMSSVGACRGMGRDRIMLISLALK